MAKKKDEIALCEEQMLKDIKVAEGMEASVSSGSFISTASGVLSVDGNPVPGNKLVVVIADAIMENVCYPGVYDPDNPAGPECYAFGKLLDEMQPHEKVENPVHDECNGCPNNEFGTAETGKGKACRNTRRLALIPAGQVNKNGDYTLFENVEDFTDSDLVFLKLPVTSVKSYSAKIKEVAAVLKKAPYAVYMMVSAVPDQKSVFKLVFEVLEEIPKNLLPTVMKRHNEAEAVIAFPYPDFDNDDKPSKKSSKKATKKTPAKKGVKKTAAKKTTGNRRSAGTGKRKF